MPYARGAGQPLRGLAAGTEYIASVVDQIDGQVLLVGHPYAGTIISNVVAKARNVVEIEGSHLIMVSQPEAVTDVILEAARAGATQ